MHSPSASRAGLWVATVGETRSRSSAAASTAPRWLGGRPVLITALEAVGVPLQVYNCPCRYFSPLSHATVTTVCPGHNADAMSRAAVTFRPLDQPAEMQRWMQGAARSGGRSPRGRHGTCLHSRRRAGAGGTRLRCPRRGDHLTRPAVRSGLSAGSSATIRADAPAAYSTRPRARPTVPGRDKVPIPPGTSAFALVEQDGFLDASSAASSRRTERSSPALAGVTAH